MKTISSGYPGLVIVLLLSHAAAAQQNPHGQLPVTSVAQPYLFLIRDPVVHDDLRLSPHQRQAVATLNDELDGALWSMRNKSAQHIDKTMQEAAATAWARLSSILTRDQEQRLVQIEMWTLGTKAFMRDDLPEKLGLSEDQRSEIRETVERTQEAMADLGKQLQSGRSRQSLEEEARELQTDEQKQILKTLSGPQRQQWIALLGRRIDVSNLGRVRFKAPELRPGDWINSSPLTLQQLQGKVVALHYYAFGCINCKRNFPWYKGWHESFADRGLVVLGVHTPEVARERDQDNVRREARDAGLAFPILVDNDKQNWDAWGNSMWPSVYLIDKWGYVRYWWYGELNWQGAEGEKLLRQRIEELLAER